jgi:DNA-directed RNA polymerase subunit RPC12/RpoP
VLFLVAGIQPIQRDVKDAELRRARCATCGMVSNFRTRSRLRYLTLFFLPVIPLSKAELIFTCERCGAPLGDESQPGPSVFVCPCCATRVNVRLQPGADVRVTCPHCGDEFSIGVNRV